MPVQTTYGLNAPIGIVGGIADAGLADGRNIAPMVNAEASAAVPYGHAVKVFLATGDGYDGFQEANQGAKLPAANTDAVWGLVVHSPVTMDDVTIAAGVFGVAAGGVINVMRRGRMIVKPEASSGVVPGARLYVRAVAGAGEYLGGLRGSADSTDCIPCTNQGVWITKPDAVNGLAILEVDFIGEGGVLVNA